MLRQVASVPGVASATFAAEMPLSPVHSTAQVGALSVTYNMVGPDYLGTAGIALLAGRDFEARDGKAPARIAVVNQSLARLLWGEASPIGRVLEFQDRPGRITRVEVVGLARDSRYESVWESGEPYLYLSAIQWQRPVSNFLVRTVAPPQGLMAAVRRQWEAAASQAPLNGMEAGEGLLALAVAPQRLAALLLGAFGLLALFLATVGLYSVMAFSVGRRTREIGIRLAIGARPASVLRDVLRSALAMAGIGLSLGTVACLALMRLLASQVRDVSPYDGVTFLVVALLLVAVSAAAALAPAVRASRVDPAQALRGE